MTGHVRELADRWPWLKDMTGDPNNAADAGAGWRARFRRIRRRDRSRRGGAEPDRRRLSLVRAIGGGPPSAADSVRVRVRAGGATSDRSSRINVAIASYLRAKVLAGLILALPAAIILWAFGVKSALFWGVLTFMLSFVPYVGSGDRLDGADGPRFSQPGTGLAADCRGGVARRRPRSVPIWSIRC